MNLVWGSDLAIVQLCSMVCVAVPSKVGWRMCMTMADMKMMTAASLYLPLFIARAISINYISVAQIAAISFQTMEQMPFLT